MKNILFFLVAATIYFGVPGMVHSGGWVIDREGPFKGRIIDAETKEPIEGAVVVAQYYVRTLYPIGWRSDCKDIQEALTNKKGEFLIPSLTMLISPLSFGDDTSFLIWKPGYKRKDIWGGYFFAKEPGTVENRPTHTAQGLELEPTRLGIVELIIVRTMEERRMEKPSPVGDKDDWKKQKQFINMIREEWKYIYSEDPGNLYKIEEEN
jgi:hypothetical protein